ncbi:centromere protein L isoform X2 [Mugil cephalus]|uniref:centromere protein L isoform X2 n=1 Tax=Mugil cephalus TaxID=48193 RepID=UPI001FB63EE3|nr:centromere protein L isoform X2 [Mugil cephalus]
MDVIGRFQPRRLLGKRVVQICFRFLSASVGTENMERPRISETRTPSTSVGVQRRSKSKSYRQSYHSLGAASRLGLTPGFTARRLNTKRRAPKRHSIAEKVSPDHLALLLKTEWQLSYVTPLYHFRHTQLKSYARQLSAFIAAEKEQGLAVEVEGLQSGFRASFSAVRGMAATDDDPETVFVQILSKPPFAKKDEPQKSVWSGWLSCVNGNAEYLSSLPEEFTCLPLFGSSGSEALTAAVKSWFKQTFDCCFGPLEISHTSLQWLVALWTNCHAESNIQHLKMIWSLPSAPPLQVTYTVSPGDAWELWSSVRKSPAGEEASEEASSIDIEEVTGLMKGLSSHFYRHFRLDLSAGSLSQVATALGSAKHGGKIKMSNSRYVITTLTLLTECALLKMPI